MGAKKQPKPPPPPDPRQIAQTDVEFNRLDQYTPFGNLTFSGPNRNVANLSLSPELQQIFNQQIGTDLALGGLTQQAAPAISNLVNQPFNPSGLPALNIPNAPTLPQSADAFRSDIERQFFDRSRGLLDEQFGREEDRLRQTLANQGLQSGGEAFGAEFGDFNRRRGDTYSNLARDAVLFGGQEASRALADQLGLSSLQNQFGQQQLQNAAGIRGQLFGEQQFGRQNQFNELASLLGLQQNTAVPGLSNFFAPSQAGVGDAYALNQASQINSFNQRSESARAAKGEFSDLLQTAISSGGGKGKGGAK